MNRSSSKNHNENNNSHCYADNSLNMSQNNNNFQDYLQSSNHNLSYTNLHQTSFDMEDAYIPPHNMPLSPVCRSSNYIPQSFLSKPFEENNYDTVEQKSQKWKINWANNTPGINGLNTPIGNGGHIQSLYEASQLQNQQKGDSLWDSNYLNENINEFSSNNFANNFNETPISHLKNPYNNQFRQNNQNDRNFGMDMEEDFPNSNRPNHNAMDIEGSNTLNDSPKMFKKNNNIVINYDNYQKSIKADNKSQHNNNFLDNFDNNTSRNTKTFNYLFNNVNDHINNDFKFSPVKSTKNIPFINSSYLYDKVPNQSGLGNFKSQSDELSPKLQSFMVDEVPTTTGNNQQNNIQASQPCVCNCKKTKCLKLYCECFAKLGYCGEGCHCHECKNKPENEDERQNAIQEAKLRNHDAFVPKSELELKENKAKAANEQLKKGCNCRKTKCLKKYCECFNAGTYCNNMCKCDSCENHPRNAALIQQKKNGSCSQMSSQIIQHHEVETRPLSLVVSEYNTGRYYQNTYDYPSTASLHLQQHSQIPTSVNSSLLHPSSESLLHSQRAALHHKNQQELQSNSLFSQNNRIGIPFLNSQSLYKSSRYQERLLFEDDNEDSDQTNSSKSKQDKKYFLNKAPYFRKQKKPIIKNRKGILENSDEDIEVLSQDQEIQQQKVTLLRNKRNPVESQLNDNKDLSLSEEEIQQKQIEDMEKKLKQIQQVQQFLQQQQQLKMEQEKLLQQNFNSVLSKESLSSDKLKEDLGENSPQQKSSPINNENKDEQFIEIESSDSKNQENMKALQILNGIRKNKKKNLKKRENNNQQLSEEKKLKQNENPQSQKSQQYVAYDEDQESSVSHFSQATSVSQYKQSEQQHYGQFRTRLCSENYESLRQKGIQNSSYLLSVNPAKFSTNLFNPSSYNRDDALEQYNEFCQSQSGKQNPVQAIRAP